MPILLQLNSASNWGSTGKITEQIGQKVMEAGWESYVIYGRKEYSQPSRNNVILIGCRGAVYEHYFEHVVFDREGLASRLGTKEVIKQIESIRPDVIQLHVIHDHWLNYQILFSYLAKTRIPVVWTQHDQWAITGHCYYDYDCVLWKTECHNCPQRNKFSFDRSRRNYNLKKSLFTSLKSLTIVPVSNWLADYVHQSFFKDCSINVIHNGIDLTAFKPHNTDVRIKYGLSSKKIVLGVANGWSKRKGLSDFFSLAKLLPSEQFEIVLVGKVDRIDVVNKVSEFKISFIDRTQSSLELAQLYSSASVFVNPTYQDNYPTTNLEAMACGTPVVTYRTGGSPEAVMFGEGLEEIDKRDGLWLYPTGAVVDQGNVVALKEAIIELSNRDLCKVCRKHAEEFFDKDKCFSNYIKLYASLLGRE